MQRVNNIQRTKLLVNASPLHNQNAGIHVWTAGFLRALHQRDNGMEVLLIVEQKTNQFPKFKQLIIPTVKWLPGYATFRYFIFFPLAAWWNRVTHVLEPAHFGPFNLPRKIKRLTVIHDLTPILFPQWHNFNSWFLQKLFLPGILKRAVQIITVSRSTQRDLIKYVPSAKEKIKVIYPGVSFNNNQNVEEEQEFPWEVEQPFILYVGTLEPRKNIDTLIRAFDLLKKDGRNDDLELWLIGQRGWKNEQIDRALESSPHLDSIHLKGYVPLKGLKKAYQNCSVFVYPSLYEGFGLPIVEALYYGAKVVTSNNSSLKEIGGEWVTLVEDPLNPLALAEGIQGQLVASPPPLASVRKFLERYTWDRAVENFTKLLERQSL
jgi:glycosyltransferase involved in cell wall biosynthesis